MVIKIIVNINAKILKTKKICSYYIIIILYFRLSLFVFAYINIFNNKIYPSSRYISTMKIFN